MIDRSDLRAAVAASVLSSDQASRLEAFLANRAKGGEEGAGESENLRFLANFNDIFITLGIVILFTGFTALLGMSIGPSLVNSGSPLLLGLLFAGAIGGAAWLMMEYFCNRRRLLLPSMVLAIIVTLCGTVLGLSIGTQVLGEGLDDIDNLFEGVRAAGTVGVMSFLGGLAASTGIFLRFRLPFALALIAVSAAGAVYVFAGAFGNFRYLWGGLAVLLMGLATLATAIWFDMRDPERITRSSDNAFWLHLAAAPQVIYGLQGIITGSTFSEGGSGSEAILLLVALVALGILSLALNRRALIAASLLTFTAALTEVLSDTGAEASTIFIIVTMLIGGGVVLIGAGWKTARHLVLKLFPTSGIWGRLFPPEIA